jgi:hypothetical protein
MILCACNCGNYLESRDDRGRPRIYLAHHHWRGRRRPTHERADANYTSKCETARNRTRDKVGCELHRIGDCLGIIDVHHVDSDFTNNEPTNLMKLCRAHHRLVENGKIDLAHPVMLTFYVDASGKRRYG